MEAATPLTPQEEWDRLLPKKRLTIGNVLEPVTYPRLDPLTPTGGQRGGRVGTPEDALVKESIAAKDLTWGKLRAAEATLTPDRLKQVQAEIIRGISAIPVPPLTPQNPTTTLEKFFDAFPNIAPEVVNMPGDKGLTALMIAAVNGQWTNIQELLTRGANPNLQNELGETALMWAAAYNEISAVRELKKAQLDYNVVDNLGWNALMVAAWCGHDQIVMQLGRRTDTAHRTAAGQNAAQLARDPRSPAQLRNNVEKTLDKVIANLQGYGEHPQQGGRRRTYRSKTNSKKRGTR
jgi:hypothetical protein